MIFKKQDLIHLLIIEFKIKMLLLMRIIMQFLLTIVYKFQDLYQSNLI